MQKRCEVETKMLFYSRRGKKGEKKTHFKVKRLTYQIKHKINEIESVQKSQKILSKYLNGESIHNTHTHTAARDAKRKIGAYICSLLVTHTHSFID